jgi:hypothetical protein
MSQVRDLENEMWDVATTTTQTARKDYQCEASNWIIETGIGEFPFSFAELRLIAKAKRDDWKIKKGQQYVKVCGKWDGEWSVFRARPEINNLCQYHGIYQE